MDESSEPRPGWWVASDGLYYPPERLPAGWVVGPDGRPAAAPVAPPPPAPFAPPPPPPAPFASPQAGAGYYTALPPHQAIGHMAVLITQMGGTITSQSNNTITGTVRTRGEINAIAAIVLFLLCVVPFILYLITANKDTFDPFTVTLIPDGTGTRILGSGGGMGLQCAERAAMAMPR